MTQKLKGSGAPAEFKAPKGKASSTNRTVRTDEDDEPSEANNLTAEDDNTNSFERTSGGTILANLSKKKQQYIEQTIVDRSGAYDYAQDPDTYKKARK